MTSKIAVLGAGAFGTALAMTQAAEGRRVALWGRNVAVMQAMARDRQNADYLPDISFAPSLHPTSDLQEAVTEADVVLLVVPTQSLRGLLQTQGASLAGKLLVVCCKGVERGTGLLPTQVVQEVLPGARTAVLTGPSFAADIAVQKPTALTLATTDTAGADLQAMLSTQSLRVYLSEDPIGAQLGGALKNVVALAAGLAIGAGFGESARAALMTRGFAEITRYAQARGAQEQTLFGLSGFGDLVLTCSSTQSRNYSFGIALARGEAEGFTKTVEGVMTAHAVAEAETGLEMPLTQMVSRLLKGEIPLSEAALELLNRPLRRETEL